MLGAPPALVPLRTLRLCGLVGCPGARRADRHGVGVGRPADGRHVGAGGFGILAAVTMTPPTSCARGRRRARQRTDAPFGVNLRPTSPTSPTASPSCVREGVRWSASPAPPPRTPSPGCHDAGVLVMPTVGARRHAEKVLELGRRRRHRPGRRGRRPHRHRAHLAAAARGGRRRRRRSPCSAPAGSTTAAASSPRWPTAPTASPWAPGSCSPRRAACPTAVKARYLAAAVTDTVVTTALDGAPQRVIRTDVVDRLERSSALLRFPAPRRSALRVPQGDRHAAARPRARGPGHERNQDLTWSRWRWPPTPRCSSRPRWSTASPRSGSCPPARSPASSTSCRPSPTSWPASRPRPRPPSTAWGRPMDLTWSAAEEAFRAEARAWLEAEPGRVARRPRRDAIASGDTREGFAQHLDWERRLFAGRWAAVSWPAAHGGRDASLWEWLIFEEEYYRAGAPPRVTQNGIFLLAPHRLRVRHPSSRPTSCPAWPPPRTCGARAGPSPTPAATSPASRRTADGSTAAGCSTARRPGPPAAPSAPTCSGCSAPTPTAERHKGLTYLLVPLDTPGVTVRGFGRLDGDEGFAEVFFDDAFLPTTPSRAASSSARRARLAVAMATTGSERGLTLRSPGRFLATAERLIDLYRRDRGPTGLRGAGRRGVDADAEAYQLQTLQTVTRAGRRAPMGAESEPRQDLVVGARRRAARDRARPARPDAELEGPPWTTRAGSSRCRARSTPAPTRSSATSPPSASSGCRGCGEVRLRRRPARLPRTPCGTSPRSARRRSCGPRTGRHRRR